MSFVFMESLCATFRAGVGTWFCGPKPTAVVVNCDDDDDDDDGCSDECARALAIRHVGTCIDSCVQWLMAATPGSPQPVPECKQLLRDCESMWRSKFKAWQEPCGNHLNVPDLLFVSACHLRVLLMPAADRQTDRATIGSIKRLQTRLTTALREWNRAPSVLHAEHRSVIDTCARVIVLWGSRITSKKLTETTLSAEDVSMLTMNVNVHQNLDNRARNTDLTPIATKALTESSTAIVDDCECLLRDIVCLASRYAFFATLHHAVRMAAANPHNTLHQRVALEAVRPAADLVHANVIKFGALFLECSRTSLPEFVHREINYTIWKWLLSVGSMEVQRRRLAQTCRRPGVLANGTNHRVAQAESSHRLDPRTNCRNLTRRIGARSCNQRLRRRDGRMAGSRAGVSPRCVALDTVAPIVH